jgi:hypothetical protein
MESGDILGHENMGEVIELGSEVTNLKIGDRSSYPSPLAAGSAGSKLLFQFLDQPLESLLGNRVGGFRGHALGLLKPPFKFFSIALFSHGDTLLHHIRRSGGPMVHFTASVSA